jgi:hypothetical protein
MCPLNGCHQPEHLKGRKERKLCMGGKGTGALAYLILHGESGWSFYFSEPQFPVLSNVRFIRVPVSNNHTLDEYIF